MVRPPEDLDRDARQGVRRLHLLERPRQRPCLEGEDLLQPNVGSLGPHRVGRDCQALQYLVRVSPQEEAVLEGGWLSFGGVAHRVPGPGTAPPDRSPLLAGRESGPSAARRPLLATSSITASGEEDRARWRPRRPPAVS